MAGKARYPPSGERFFRTLKEPKESNLNGKPVINFPSQKDKEDHIAKIEEDLANCQKVIDAAEKNDVQTALKFWKSVGRDSDDYVHDWAEQAKPKEKSTKIEVPFKPFQELEVGDFTRLPEKAPDHYYPVRTVVFQVISDTKVLVKVERRPRPSTLFLVSDVDTTKYADGQLIGFGDDVFHVAGTYRYASVQGSSNTVLKLVPVKVERAPEE